MARLLFIENREKTWFWAGIARLLAEQGHDIAWLVQNPMFGRSLPGRTHLIPFPRRDQLDAAARCGDFPALATDRGRDHFGAGTAHYPYYSRAVQAIIDGEAPDLVVGEPTLFHELLAVEHCARRGIPFAHPVGERYPPGRFVIFDGASQRPLIESGEQLDQATALDLATRIADGRSIPSYMVRGGGFERMRARARWAVTRSRVMAGHWRGERYNTPSTRRKLALNRNARANLARWRAAASLPANPAGTILYPLQMQPENTIDVWGRPDWDQVDIARRLLAATGEDVKVALKANPKPYYELSNALLDFAMGHPRIHLLPVEMSMTEALRHATGTVTVTGTVGYEAVCGRGRCLSTNHPLLSDAFAEFASPSVEVAAQRLLADPDAGRGSPRTGARLMQHLTRRSFEGVICDPVNAPESMVAENVGRVARALALAIESRAVSP